MLITCCRRLSDVLCPLDGTSGSSNSLGHPTRKHFGTWVSAQVPSESVPKRYCNTHPGNANCRIELIRETTAMHLADGTWIDTCQTLLVEGNTVYSREEDSYDRVVSQHPFKARNPLTNGDDSVECQIKVGASSLLFCGPSRTCSAPSPTSTPPIGAVLRDDFVSKRRQD